MECQQCHIATLPWKLRTGAISFICVPCMLRWFSRMTPEEMKANAPVIAVMSGEAFLEEVRSAWRNRK